MSQFCISKVSLRQAQLKDSCAIRHILIAARKEWMAYAPLAHSPDQVLSWVEHYLVPIANTQVAVFKGEIVGLISTTFAEEFTWIEQFYLKPGYVGKGVGSMMLDSICNTHRGTLRLFTFQQNHLAKTFYERHGFVCIGLSEGENNEENCPDALYEKVIEA